jgi:hypothetical protein
MIRLTQTGPLRLLAPSLLKQVFPGWSNYRVALNCVDFGGKIILTATEEEK